MFLLALDLQPDAAVGQKPRLFIKTLLLRFFGLLLGAVLDLERKGDGGDFFRHFIYGDPSTCFQACVYVPWSDAIYNPEPQS